MAGPVLHVDDEERGVRLQARHEWTLTKVCILGGMGMCVRHFEQLLVALEMRVRLRQLRVPTGGVISRSKTSNKYLA